MPLPIISGVGRFAVNGINANGQPWTNVIHCQTAGGFSVLNVDDAFDVIENLYDKDGGGGITDGHGNWAADPDTALEIVCTPLDGVTTSMTRSISKGGTTGQQSLPGQTAVICSHLTGTRGRSHRGRTFWSSPYEGMTNADGSVVSTTVTGIETAWDEFRTALDLVDIKHVVASYKLESFDVIIGTTVRTYFGHQDRRRN